MPRVAVSRPCSSASMAYGFPMRSTAASAPSLPRTFHASKVLRGVVDYTQQVGTVSRRMPDQGLHSCDRIYATSMIDSVPWWLFGRGERLLPASLTHAHLSSRAFPE